MTNWCNTPWTDDAIETLRAMWRAGLSASAIARELGPPFTRNSVIGQAHRLHLSGRPSPIGKYKLTDDDVVEMRRLYREGWRISELMEKYGISKGHTQKLCYGQKRTDIVLPIKRKPAEAPKHTGCQYPLWKDEVTHEYCGAPRKAHYPYCNKHHAVCYRRLRVAEQEAA